VVSHPDTWFQLRDKPDFAYPYILVKHQWIVSAAVPRLEEAARKMVESNAKIKAQGDAQFGGAVKNLVLDEPRVDWDRRRVWWTTESEVSGAGRIKTLAGLFPGKEGVAVLYCCAPVVEYQQYQPEFEHFLDTFKYEPGFGYEALHPLPGQTGGSNLNQKLPEGSSAPALPESPRNNPGSFTQPNPDNPVPLLFGLAIALTGGCVAVLVWAVKRRQGPQRGKPLARIPPEESAGS
jgi:hypothetical protein